MIKMHCYLILFIFNKIEAHEYARPIIFFQGLNVFTLKFKSQI